MDARANEVHPGEILSEEFMRPLGLTEAALALELDMPVAQLNALISGANPVTERIASILATYFKVSPRFWLNLQAEYDVRTAKNAI
jgi:addiction module HigA family antidote